MAAIKSKDSIKYKIKNQLFNIDRKNSILTQTPQAFRFKDLYDLSIKQKRIIIEIYLVMFFVKYVLSFIIICCKKLGLYKSEQYYFFLFESL